MALPTREDFQRLEQALDGVTDRLDRLIEIQERGVTVNVSASARAIAHEIRDALREQERHG